MSPRAIGQLIDDGPRYLGSSDGWYWMVPCLGMLTNSCGANCSTKAMTPMSALRSFIACAASGAFSDGSWNTLRPFSTAATFMGSGLAPSFSGAHEHARDGVATREECLEDCLAEVLLSDDCDFHFGSCSRKLRLWKRR